jgi:hypothetical protein
LREIEVFPLLQGITPRDQQRELMSSPIRNGPTSTSEVDPLQSCMISVIASFGTDFRTHPWMCKEPFWGIG